MTFCPGFYCGRTIINDGNYSNCEACPSGWRANEKSICSKCTDEPTFYDYMYLLFMIILPLSFNYLFIDITNQSKKYIYWKVIVLYISATIECILAAIFSILVTEPLGKMRITSCKVLYLSDWYTIFFNPSIDYINTIHCTQEAVYPLYRILFINYAFSLILMLIFRILISTRCKTINIKSSVYFALYMYPILTCVHAIFSGLIYFSYPYLILIASIFSVAAHFASFDDPSPMYLLLIHFTSIRNAIIFVSHILAHIFGIITITQITQPYFHLPMLLLAFLPSLIYIATVHFTAPSRLLLD